MSFTYQKTIERSKLNAAGVNTQSPKAQDRRKTIEVMFGSWFKDHGFKLTRDYLIEFLPYGSQGLYVPAGLSRLGIKITILNPKKAVLFKLTWGGL